MRIDELFTRDEDTKIYKKLVKIVHSDSKDGNDDDIKDLNHARDINDVATLRRLEKKYLDKPKEEKEEWSENGNIEKSINDEIAKRMPNFAYMEPKVEFAMYNDGADFKLKIRTKDNRLVITDLFPMSVFNGTNGTEEMFDNINNELYRLDKRSRK